MKYIRCRGKVGTHYGVLEEGEIRLLRRAPWLGIEFSGATLPVAEAQLLAPCEPSKIVAVGINYAPHARELSFQIPQEPLLFLKPPSAVIGPGEEIVLPSMSSRVDYEGEMAVVIGRKTRNIAVDDALMAVFGLTCCNDVTARDLQQRDVQFTRSKSFDTFCPLGPCVVSGCDPDHLVLRTLVNGEKRQESPTSAMIRPVAELVAFISRIMTLLPGDVIATGTPAGVGPLHHGDSVCVAVDGIGELNNPVRGQA